MSLYQEDKKLYRFMKHIEFIRGYFKDGEWVDVVNLDHVHLEGITRKEAQFLYEKECRKKKKYDSMLGRIKSTVTQRAVMILDDNYKTLLELMDIFGKDFIDEKDLDSILVDVKSFYDKYYRDRESNIEKNTSSKPTNEEDTLSR